MICEQCGRKIQNQEDVFCLPYQTICENCFEEYIRAMSPSEIAESMGIETDEADNFYEIGRGSEVCGW